MSIRNLRNKPVCGKYFLILLILVIPINLVRGWKDGSYKIVFNGKPERTLCFESHPEFVIAKACLNNNQRKEDSKKYCHIYDTVELTEVGDNFGFGVYIPPFDSKACANQTSAQSPVNHVVLSRKNQLIVCSLSDYTFDRNNCNGQVEFQLFDPNSKNNSSKETILDMSLPKSQRLFPIAPKTHQSANIQRILVVSKTGKTSIKRFRNAEDLTNVKLRKHSMFYLMKVMD